MKYKITLNGKTYEVEVEEGQAMLVDEYEAYKPAAPAAAPAPAPVWIRPGSICRKPPPHSYTLRRQRPPKSRRHNQDLPRRPEHPPEFPAHWP